MFAFTTPLSLTSQQQNRRLAVSSVRSTPRYTAVLRPGSRFRNLPSIPVDIATSTQQQNGTVALDVVTTTSTVTPNKKPFIVQVLSERITYIAALLKRNRLRHARALRYARLAVAGIFALIAVISLHNTGVLANSTATATATTTSAGLSIPSGLSRLPIPEPIANAIRPFTESFGVVFLSEFGDKSMFATALMAMKYSPVLVLIGALAALTVMTLIACFLGQLMHYLPATVTHYSSIALFVFFGAQMLLQARDLPSTPGGRGGERADAETMVADMTVSNVRQSPLAILAKISSLIFVAEWCDRSMIATMALAASSNTLAVVGGATVANVVCTGFAVGAAAIVASRISERTVAIVAGVLFEVFAVFTFFEGPES